MNSLESAFDKIAQLLNIVAGAGVCLMAVHVVLDVMGRYAFSKPLDGTIEIVSYYYMIGVIFLPLAAIQLGRRHFAAEVFTDRLPASLLRTILVLGDAFTAILCGIAAWQSAVAAAEKMRGNEHLETAHFIIYQWPGRWITFLGFTLMGAAACLCLVQDVLGPRIKPHQPALTDHPAVE
jgi:TRAP-type C4-dicarboxylate transport system permease small subunit